MRLTMELRRAVGVAGLLLALASCRSAREAELARAVRLPSAGAGGAPHPTEHRLDEGAEARHKAGRRAWMRDMHRAAPGVDWQAIERENGRREMARRAGLASGAAALQLPSWTEVGSRNQAGRMHSAALSPDGTTLYGASALGGVWRAAPDGSGWTPLGDNLYGGSRLLLVVPGSQPGDPDALLSATSDRQLRITRDGGATWTVPPGLPTDYASIRGLARLQDAAGTILVAGRAGGLARLHASVDGGLSFQERWSSGLAGPPSIFVPRLGAAAATDLWLLHAGRLLRSVDGGQTLLPVSTANAAATDGVLAGSEAGAPTLYASLEVGGSWSLHRSDDAGQSWTEVNGLAGYWRALEASSVDPQLVAYGSVDCWRSSDGGQSFQRVNGWGEYYGDPAGKLHADVQGLVCLPEPGLEGLAERWYVATDGGLYESLDGLQTVSNLSLTGLGVSQYYSTLSSSTDPDRIAAGSQDQGYQLGVLAPSSGAGPSTDLAQLISGDYGHLTSSDGSHGLVYSTYPGFILVQEGETSPILRSLDFPPGETSLWLPPVVADPLDPETFYFLGSRLWRYRRVTTAGWSRTLHSQEDFLAGGSGLLSALAFAPTDPDRVYAVNTAGRCFSSVDHGVTWTAAQGDGPDSHYFYGNALCVHPARPKEAFVGGSGYSGPGVWRTTDGGLTWQPESSGLPSTLVYDLAFGADGSGDVYAATEAGAFFWDRTTGVWENLMEPGTPLTLYWSVEAVPGGAVGDAVMRFGTYGRGIWDHHIPAGTNGTWASYGEGQGAANTLTLSSPTAPNLGGVVRFVVDGTQLPAAGPRFLLAGRQRAQLPLAGGVQLVDQVLRYFPLAPAGTGPGGLERHAFQLTLPEVSAWVGATFRFQALVPDSAVPGGTALSNGLEAVFGY